MATPKKFFFDVWLVQGNMVYRSVPYEVVTDWIQQQRLLADDHIRPTGTEEWFLLGQVPAFAGFLPPPELLRTDAQAEALEPVETGFAWSKKGEQEEADPDMIPLIDISLVLLIFFMMTSAVAAVGSGISVPKVAGLDPTLVESKTEMIWIGINYVADNQPPRYSLSYNSDQASEGNNDLTEDQVLKKIEEILQKQQRVPEIRVAAHHSLSVDLIKRIQVALEKFKIEGRVGIIRIEVEQKE
ncbi:MAG TPA: biopolymer transporter ExbD [Gemmataceae bacterium]|jgi:biopolymer transport protein ExbD|nr:biopolymer transporter ExbD [Gemmataceae bacterium]